MAISTSSSETGAKEAASSPIDPLDGGGVEVDLVGELVEPLVHAQRAHLKDGDAVLLVELVSGALVRIDGHHWHRIGVEPRSLAARCGQWRRQWAARS